MVGVPFSPLQTVSQPHLPGSVPQEASLSSSVCRLLIAFGPWINWQKINALGEEKPRY